ncbi:hypothetical protein EJB05_22813, partial [Eragrostis curvula]
LPAVSKPDVARGLVFSNPLQAHWRSRAVPVQQDGGVEEVEENVQVAQEVADALATGVNKMKVNAGPTSGDDRVSLGTSYQSSGSSSMVKSITQELETRSTKPRLQLVQKPFAGKYYARHDKPAGAQLSGSSIDSDKNWKHGTRAKDGEVVSPKKEDNRVVPVQKVFDTIKDSLARGEKKQTDGGCLASVQDDTPMLPVSPLGKRGNAGGLEGGGSRQVKGEADGGVAKKGRKCGTNPAAAVAAGNLTGAHGEPRQEQ